MWLAEECGHVTCDQQVLEDDVGCAHVGQASPEEGQGTFPRASKSDTS